MKGIVFLLGCISLYACGSMAQSVKSGSDTLHSYQFPDYFNIDTSVVRQYPFIHFEKNNFQFFSNESPSWDYLYRNMRKMIREKDRKLNFYHIGGSHLQADIYTHDMRTKLQTTWPDLPGERGFLFPFDLAKTNNPGNYEFSSPNTWTSYRSVAKDKCELDYGLLGAIVTCSDSIIDVHFRYDRTTVKPPFSRIRIFHNKGEIPYDIGFGAGDSLIMEIRKNCEIGYMDIYLKENVSSFDLKFSKNCVNPYELRISAIQLTNQEPGVSYTSIGINGAGLYTYLECGNFEEQLRQSQPDLFVFSVGTNDAYVPYDQFDPEVYRQNLEKMMKIVLKANPECAILLTVPNDSYFHRSNLNKNTERQRTIINELAVKYQVPVWDLYGVMGGLGSAKTWNSAALMKDDRIHFTPIGYHLKGDLFFDAFMKWLEQMDKNEIKK